MTKKIYGDQPITVRLPASEVKRIAALARQNGLSRSDLLRRLIAVADVGKFQSGQKGLAQPAQR